MKRLGRWFKWGLLGLVAVFVAWQLWLLGWVLFWKWVDPGETRFMAIRLAELRVKNPQAQLRQQWVPYERISPHLKRAIVAAEDAKFVDHEGFDWDGIQKAIEKNQKKGRFVAGGSTITQQLAKNLFLTPTKSYLRKAEEAIITLMLESLWSKRRIFEVYLNVIEWGNGIFGAEAAARHYFGISAGQLGPEQAAKLAGMVPNPRFYDRNRNAPGLARKATIILGRMPGAETP
jgi:monofunctional biosynthetic peptidoglycan transglycosylase